MTKRVPKEQQIGVTIIDTPNDAECALPARRRLCVSVSCAAALTPRRAAGTDHPTRCAFDEGGLVDDQPGVTVVRRRDDCMRLFVCEEVWIMAHKATNIGATGMCPKDCLGFVAVGGLIPLDALTRVKTRVVTS